MAYLILLIFILKTSPFYEKNLSPFSWTIKFPIVLRPLKVGLIFMLVNS